MENSEPAAIELIKAGTHLDIKNKVCITLYSILQLVTIAIHVLFFVFTQDGDTALILATVHSKPDALLELVRAGPDLNVQNNVRYLLYTAVLCEWSQLSSLGGSNCSDDLCERLGLELEWT